MKRREKGQSLVEFAIILPLLLIVLAGVLDLGRLFYSYVAVTDAAAEGAAYGALNPGDTAGIISRAQAASGGLVQIDVGQVQVDCPTVAAGESITVTVGYTYTLATPFVGGLAPEGLPLRGVAVEVILATQ